MTKLPDKEVERIEREAEALFQHITDKDGQALYVHTYVKGATAERERVSTEIESLKNRVIIAESGMRDAFQAGIKCKKPHGLDPFGNFMRIYFKNQQSKQPEGEK